MDVIIPNGSDALDDGGGIVDVVGCLFFAVQSFYLLLRLRPMVLVVYTCHHSKM